MKPLKRMLLFFLCCLIMTSCIPITAFANTSIMSDELSLQSGEINSISIGDKIVLGNYLGTPISWICVDIDENGPLMMSETILCTKEYDAAGTDDYYHSDGWGWVRKNRGSNCWYDSNIRQWLNTVGTVEYTHCPPSYAEESGFLSCFSSAELSLVKDVIQKTYVNEWEVTRDGYVDGGSRELDTYGTITSMNYDCSNRYYQNVKDKFFLLNHVQVYNVYENNPNYISADTLYYTRIACNNGASYENTILIGDGNNYGVCWANEVRGIRPSFYLNVDNYNYYDSIEQQIGNINLGPYAVKGATINVLGQEIPLINIEALISLDITDNLQMEIASDGTINVLIGFDQNASANIDGSKNSPIYWSESYKEVKSMYQDLTGNKVDTTRLWNKFSSMSGKLKTMKANMLVNVDSNLMGYMEFKQVNGEYKFVEGGVLASFEADTSLKSYYGPCYLVLGINVGAEGSLIFINENNKINPQITVNPKFSISAGGGIGGGNTYAQIDAYGSLLANISTESENPFRAGIDIGVHWQAYLLGHQLANETKSFANMELYPNFGNAWEASLMSLTPSVDVSNANSYYTFINSGTTIDSSQSYASYSLKRLAQYGGAIFIKDNSYLLNSLQLMNFDDNTMLMIWVDENAERESPNNKTLMYTMYDGTTWSESCYLFESKTFNDMPVVYSNGTKAYIVWQKASKEFEEGTEVSEMLPYFDLYLTVFDSETKTFSEEICINEEEDTIFEFNPVIHSSDGLITVSWIENTDNNVFQMSGSNSICVANIDNNELITNKYILTETDEIITNVDISNSAIYFSLSENSINNLYYYDTQVNLLKSNITAFDCEKDNVYFTDDNAFYIFNGTALESYSSLKALQNFVVKSNNTGIALFTTQLNEDFSKTIYFSMFDNDKQEWNPLEVYQNRGKIIREFSPIYLDSGAIFVATSYLTENNDQTATIVVEQCTDGIDIEAQYVDFNETQLNTDSMQLMIGIKNNSSITVEKFSVEIIDSNGLSIHNEIVENKVLAFGTDEVNVIINLSDKNKDEIYIVKVLPYEYFDLDENNNTVSTTIQCIHNGRDIWIIDKKPSLNSCGIKHNLCQKCGVTYNETEFWSDIAIEDILTFKGYSVGPDGESMCVGFDIDYDALSLYEQQTGRTLDFGVVFTSFEALNGTLPLNNITAEANILEDAYVLKGSLKDYNIKTYDYVIKGITTEYYEKQFVIAGYVYDETAVKYIQDSSPSDTVVGMSMKELMHKEV